VSVETIRAAYEALAADEAEPLVADAAACSGSGGRRFPDTAPRRPVRFSRQ